jgi:Flp pilus assembly protein TadD
MAKWILRFLLSDDAVNFDALAKALKRETGINMLRLDAEQWVISSSQIERSVTALFDGEPTAFAEARVWLDRLKIRDIVSISPDVAVQLVFQNGVSARNLGHTEEAVAWFDRALAVDDSLAAIWSNRGNALVDLNRWEQAEASFRHAIERSPGDALVRFNFGTFLLQRERFQEAQSELAAAVRLNPQFEQARHNLEVVESLIAAH